jgi:hypothetical protein
MPHSAAETTSRFAADISTFLRRGGTKSHDEPGYKPAHEERSPVMNKTRKLAAALAALSVAVLSGCATTQVEPAAPQSDAAVPMKRVSVPADYGNRGGYRYRRLVAVTVPAS